MISTLHSRKAVAASFMRLLTLAAGFAALCTTQPLSAQNQTTTKPAATRTTYYVEPGTYGTKRETDPPRYVRDLNQLGFNKTKDISWINVGLDSRNRTEYRQNDIRRAPSFSEDVPVLFKSRAYFGFEERLGFLGATAEFQDSRRYNSQFAYDNRDWNPYTFIQAYGEMKFKNVLPKDPLGNSRPILIRGGRMTFEFLDRRLIALNQWRNTTNNFVGGRVSVGQDKNNWAVDLLALHPITRVVDSFPSKNDYDTARTDIWFYSAIGHWRQWSEYVTIEPYMIGLRQLAGVSNGNIDRALVSPGLRFTGWLNGTWNYDFSGTLQLGSDAGKTKNAHMYTAEVGYTFSKWKWKPRFSAFYGNVSGDKDPDDDEDNRFERFYGFARPWSADDYIIPENVVNARLKFECEPYKGLKMDGGYALFWLQSEKDRFNNLLAGTSNNRDKTGESGNFIGHGPEIRLTYRLIESIDFVSGYSHFFTGDFVQNRQEVANGEFAEFSNFVYLETTVNFLDLVTYIHKKTGAN